MIRHIRVIPKITPGVIGILENIDSKPVYIGGVPIRRKKIYSTSKIKINFDRYSPSIKKSTGQIKVHINFNIH